MAGGGGGGGDCPHLRSLPPLHPPGGDDRPQDTQLSRQTNLLVTFLTLAWVMIQFKGTVSQDFRQFLS